MYVRCPPLSVYVLLFNLQHSVLDSKQSWESGKFQLVSSIVSLAQLVSSSVALLATLVFIFFYELTCEQSITKETEQQLSRCYNGCGSNFIIIGSAEDLFSQNNIIDVTITLLKQAGAELCQAQGKLRLVVVWLAPC